MRRRVLILVLSGAMTSARGLRAQQKVMPVIGFLGTASPGTFAYPRLEAFRQGLREAGYVDGQNVTIEYRSVEGRYDQLPALADDFVARKVDMILAPGSTHARAAKSATSTIPILFFANDPVERGLVASLALPGGNLTGVNFFNTELMAKRFELLSELVPQAKVMALLVNPNSQSSEGMVRDVQAAAQAKGVRLTILKAGSESEIDAAFATLFQLHAGALIMGADSFLDSRREQIVASAARQVVPTIYEWSETVAAGGLISYGTNINAAFHLLGIYAGKILRGARPADLPVEQATKFELVLNLKTARALGLTIPPSILARADEVIE
jgi:putative ABC transport system substrate-binding protein